MIGLAFDYVELLFLFCIIIIITIKLELKSHDQNLNYKINTPSLASTTTMPGMIIAIYKNQRSLRSKFTVVYLLF